MNDPITQEKANPSLLLLRNSQIHSAVSSPLSHSIYFLSRKYLNASGEDGGLCPFKSYSPSKKRKKKANRLTTFETLTSVDFAQTFHLKGKFLPITAALAFLERISERYATLSDLLLSFLEKLLKN
ncbi:hypothetical protein CDAR_380321 [Caerostris darwini]|uniref:Uncharacterized protein n=1 Tax=Caerostris darwini TaxID=1538125 RepID=A0AAV4TJN0_9ARAC|nr:hypothetical protein CDAR_380321 [Caerostris darwini]